VGVRGARRDLDLAEKPLCTERGRELGLQTFDGDRAPVLQVLGQVDGRHPPAAELALDRVTVGESGLQTSERIGQGATQECGRPHHRAGAMAR